MTNNYLRTTAIIRIPEDWRADYVVMHPYFIKTTVKADGDMGDASEYLVVCNITGSEALQICRENDLEPDLAAFAEAKGGVLKWMPSLPEDAGDKLNDKDMLRTRIDAADEMGFWKQASEKMKLPIDLSRQAEYVRVLIYRMSNEPRYSLRYLDAYFMDNAPESIKGIGMRQMYGRPEDRPPFGIGVTKNPTIVTELSGKTLYVKGKGELEGYLPPHRIANRLVLCEGISSIGDYVFCNGRYLMSMTIPGSVKTIGRRAFYNSPLTWLKLSEGLESIGVQAFDGSKIEEVKLPATLRSIGSRALNTAYMHTVRSLSAVPPKLGRYAFFNYGATLYVPAQSIEAYRNADGWSSFRNIRPIYNP